MVQAATITLGVLFGLMFIGGIIQIFRDKFPDNKWLRWASIIIPTPYNLMRWFVTSQDHMDDFEKIFSKTGLVYGVTIGLVASLAWWTDQQVLYGMNFESTKNETYAFWLSLLVASLISILVFFYLSMAIKLWVNKLLNNRDYLIQFRFYAGVGLVGLLMSLGLTLNADSIARTKGDEGKDLVKQKRDDERDAHLTLLNTELANLKSHERQDSLRKVAPLYEELYADTLYWHKRVEDKRAEHKAGEFTGNLQAKLSSYEEKAAASSAKIRRKITEKKDSLADVHAGPIRAKELAIQEWRKGHDSTTTGTLKGMEGTIENHASNTIGMNIFLNLLGVALAFGLQFHVRGALAARGGRKIQTAGGTGLPPGFEGLGGYEGPPTDPLEDLDSFGPLPEMDEQPAFEDTPPMEEEPPTTEEDIETVEAEEIVEEPKQPFEGIPNDRPPVREEITGSGRKIPEPIGGIGGTPIANHDLFWERLTDGSVKVLFRGTPKSEQKKAGIMTNDDWWGYSEFRRALMTRRKRFKDSKSEEAKANQLAWIWVIEEKLDFIEANDTKKHPHRNRFDPEQPELQLFPK